MDSRTLRSAPASGQRAGYDGHKRKKGSKLHMAALGRGHGLSHLIALHVTPASTDDRTQVGKLAEAVQAATGNKPAAAAEKRGIKLDVGKRTDAKRGIVLLPRRWVVERSFAWVTRFRRLKDDEGYAGTLAGLHLVAFVCLMLKQIALLAVGS